MKRFFSKKLLCVCMVALLAVIMSTSVFADASSIIGSNLSGIEPDTPHGAYYGLDPNPTYVMNQSTSASITPSGTKVTTWSKTGHSSQLWGTWSVYQSGYSNARVIVCDSNPRLALNINRTSYAVNVVEIIGNYYRDCCFEILSQTNDTYRYYALPRKSGEIERGLVGTSVNGANFQWGGKSSASLLYRIGA